MAIPAERRQQLVDQLTRLQTQAAAAAEQHGRSADVDVYLKAVEFALAHGEFYQPNDVAIAAAALDSAAKRLSQWQQGQSPWPRQRGLVVRGYFSPVDGSPQPFGLVVPDDLDFDRPAPLYVWLHGRGDKTTDLHFMHQRETRTGQIAPAGALVLHPFGRHCVGFKHAGEIDVLDAIAAVSREYKIDVNRIALMGFSMGGAGAWHIGAHYTSPFAAISPGAGFAETAQYIGLKKEDFPSWYEQKLWQVYDVPNYARNLFNVPVVAYSGELDKQIQAARVMEAAFAEHGRELPHIIGPGMGHKYHPDSLAELMRGMKTALTNRGEQTAEPKRISWQTPTLRYNRFRWLQLLQLDEHWSDSRADAAIEGNKLTITTNGVQAFRMERPPLAGEPSTWEITIDGQPVEVTGDTAQGLDFVKRGDKWQPLNDWRDTDRLQPGDPLLKRPGLQGPIDDAFLSPFLVVLPSGECQHPAVQRWVDFEQRHFAERWQALMRGKLRTSRDIDVTDDDIAKYNLVLWGDPTSNRMIRRLLNQNQLPVEWQDETLQIGGRQFQADRHVPAMIYPNPLNPRKYIVFNSGLTFREGHDRTNSLQNPKLPDWAVIDITQDPDETAPGRIAAADFFDEQWHVSKRNFPHNPLQP